MTDVDTLARAEEWRVTTSADVELLDRRFTIMSQAFQLTASESDDFWRGTEIGSVEGFFPLLSEWSDLEMTLAMEVLELFDVQPYQIAAVVNTTTTDERATEIWGTIAAHYTWVASDRHELGMTGEEQGAVAQVLVGLPLPVFGSPPETWTTAANLLRTGPVVAVSGYAVANDEPLIAAISGASVYLLWLLRPAANVIRRSLAERVARALGTSVDPDDFK